MHAEPSVRFKGQQGADRSIKETDLDVFYYILDLRACTRYLWVYENG